MNLKYAFEDLVHFLLAYVHTCTVWLLFGCVKLAFTLNIAVGHDKPMSANEIQGQVPKIGMK